MANYNGLALRRLFIVLGLKDITLYKFHSASKISFCNIDIDSHIDDRLQCPFAKCSDSFLAVSNSQLETIVI